VVVAPIATLSSWPASVIIWPAGAVVLFALTRLSQDGWLRRGLVFAATGWAVLTAGAVFRLLGYGNRWTAIALIVAALSALALAIALSKREWTHRAAEVAAGVCGAFGVLLGTTDDPEWLPWTIAGAGVALLAIVSPTRRWYRWPGGAMLGVAYVLRLVDAGVDVIEAYTAPFAVVLLAAGLWTMRKSPALSTARALSAGTTLALLPSLPQAIDEPTSLRALLLGLVALAMLGVGLVCKWKAPFVGGVSVLLALLLANFGPWALAVPRWILIAVLGAVAIAIGATWENRVRQGRAAVRYVDALR
jgi:hypothetical protein